MSNRRSKRSRVRKKLDDARGLDKKAAALAGPSARGKQNAAAKSSKTKSKKKTPKKARGVQTTPKKPKKPVPKVHRSILVKNDIDFTKDKRVEAALKKESSAWKFDRESFRKKHPADEAVKSVLEEEKQPAAKAAKSVLEEEKQPAAKAAKSVKEEEKQPAVNAAKSAKDKQPAAKAASSVKKKQPAAKAAKAAKAPRTATPPPSRSRRRLGRLRPVQAVKQIQAKIRGKQARKFVRKKKKIVVNATVKIQKVTRGRQARARSAHHKKKKSHRHLDVSATKIQTMARGRKARKQVRRRRGHIAASSVWHRLSMGVLTPAQKRAFAAKCAIKVQKIFRSLLGKRRHDAKKKAHFAEANRIHVLRRESAKMIQRRFRGRLGWKMFKTLIDVIFEKRFDARTKSYYYRNKRDGSTQWEKPEVLNLLPDKDIDCEIEKELTPDYAALKIQRVFRKMLTRTKLEEVYGRVFERVHDPYTGHCYYFNKLTQEATWEKPKLLGDVLDVPFREEKRAAVDSFLTKRQRMVSHVTDEEARDATQALFGKMVKIVRISVQQLNIDCCALVAQEEYIEGATETETFLAFDQPVQKAQPFVIQRALGPLRYRLYCAYGPKVAYGKVDRAKWEDIFTFYAFYSPQKQTHPFDFHWRRSDPVTHTPMFRLTRANTEEKSWQWSRLFAFHAMAGVAVNLFETESPSRGCLLLRNGEQPPSKDWRFQYTFYGLLKPFHGTGLFNVQKKNLNDNPENTYCKITTNKPKEGWRHDFHFHAFVSPVRGTHRLHVYFAHNPDRTRLSFDLEHKPWRHRESIYIFF